jgi:hypothetical protein
MQEAKFMFARSLYSHFRNTYQLFTSEKNKKSRKREVASAKTINLRFTVCNIFKQLFVLVYINYTKEFSS